jgi:OTU-like cysteine protease
MDWMTYRPTHSDVSRTARAQNDRLWRQVNHKDELALRFCVINSERYEPEPDDLLADHEYDIFPVEGEGNCFFDSVAEYLTRFGLPRDHVQVRQEITDHLRENKDWYMQHEFFQGRDNGDAARVDAYIARMRRQGEWGSVVEIRAAAYIYEYVLGCTTNAKSKFLTCFYLCYRCDIHTLSYGIYDNLQGVLTRAYRGLDTTPLGPRIAQLGQLMVLWYHRFDDYLTFEEGQEIQHDHLNHYDAIFRKPQEPNPPNFVSPLPAGQLVNQTEQDPNQTEQALQANTVTPMPDPVRLFDSTPGKRGADRDLPNPRPVSRQKGENSHGALDVLAAAAEARELQSETAAQPSDETVDATERSRNELAELALAFHEDVRYLFQDTVEGRIRRAERMEQYRVENFQLEKGYKETTLRQNALAENPTRQQLKRNLHSTEKKEWRKKAQSLAADFQREQRRSKEQRRKRRKQNAVGWHIIYFRKKAKGIKRIRKQSGKPWKAFSFFQRFESDRLHRFANAYPNMTEGELLARSTWPGFDEHLAWTVETSKHFQRGMLEHQWDLRRGVDVRRDLVPLRMSPAVIQRAVSQSWAHLPPAVKAIFKAMEARDAAHVAEQEAIMRGGNQRGESDVEGGDDSEGDDADSEFPMGKV